MGNSPSSFNPSTCENDDDKYIVNSRSSPKSNSSPKSSSKSRYSSSPSPKSSSKPEEIVFIPPFTRDPYYSTMSEWIMKQVILKHKIRIDPKVISTMKLYMLCPSIHNKFVKRSDALKILPLSSQEVEYIMGLKNNTSSKISLVHQFEQFLHDNRTTVDYVVLEKNLRNMLKKHFSVNDSSFLSKDDEFTLLTDYQIAKLLAIAKKYQLRTNHPLDTIMHMIYAVPDKLELLFLRWFEAIAAFKEYCYNSKSLMGERVWIDVTNNYMLFNPLDAKNLISYFFDHFLKYVPVSNRDLAVEEHTPKYNELYNILVL
jgi:hypothetical protein